MLDLVLLVDIHGLVGERYRDSYHIPGRVPIDDAVSPQGQSSFALVEHDRPLGRAPGCFDPVVPCRHIDVGLGDRGLTLRDAVEYWGENTP
jgi:hypothetical protein